MSDLVEIELPEAADLDSKDLDPDLRIALWAIQYEEWQSVMSIFAATYDGDDPGTWRGAHLLGTYGAGVRGESVRRALEANAETILREPEAWECGAEEPLSDAFEFYGDENSAVEVKGKYSVWCPEYGETEGCSVLIEAVDAAHAAEIWADKWDIESCELTIVGGKSSPLLKVRAHASPARDYRVEGRVLRAYSAFEVKR